MKIGHHLDSPVDAYIPRQIRIGTEYPGPAAAFNWCIKMNDLFVAVNAGIGSARALHSNRTISDSGKRLLQSLLHGFYIEVGLRLPTAVVAAVVLDSTGDSCSGRNKIGGEMKAGISQAVLEEFLLPLSDQRCHPRQFPLEFASLRPHRPYLNKLERGQVW